MKIQYLNGGLANQVFQYIFYRFGQLTGTENLYYHGYWLHPGYFLQYQDILRQELVFPPITDSYNQSIASDIMGSHSVAIHIRRGDYVSLGWDSPVEYYFTQTTGLVQKYPDVVFFIFSDDPAWCKENAHALGLDLAGNTVFVEGNTHGNNFRDLLLMSMCQILLAGKSAFSYLSRLLNPRLELVLSDHTP